MIVAAAVAVTEDASRWFKRILADVFRFSFYNRVCIRVACLEFSSSLIFSRFAEMKVEYETLKSVSLMERCFLCKPHGVLATNQVGFVLREIVGVKRLLALSVLEDSMQVLETTLVWIFTDKLIAATAVRFLHLIGIMEYASIW